ncbi:MAG TPA: hypothetical protein VKE70_29025 [Candidatus Solibacter sp.]|nr:hypothetical protein [Candidatus Solibacter sp.]
MEGLYFSEFGFDDQGLPISPSASKTGPHRASCPSAAKLIEQMTRYVRGDVDGRCCLIAGPRGSGKTTMIETAQLAVRKNAPNAIPVVVRLHGPSLIDPPGMEDPKKKDLYEHILRLLVVSLYQTAAEEFARSYRDRMSGFTEDCLERVGQLRLTLDGAPSASVIRSFWQAADGIEHGVLFDKASQVEPGQGSCEITLLATAAEAYRSCTGKVEASTEDQTGLNRQQALKAAIEAKGENLKAGLTSLFAGIAGATGSALAGAGPEVSALCGALAAILGMVSLSFSSSFSRETSAKQALKFLPDTTVAGLFHRVPLLLDRFMQARLAPIFVIDELDKVPSLARRLDDIVAWLKGLCADRAFFCFLTDRTYLRDVTKANRRAANSRLLTAYTNLLFVFYDVESLDEYLGFVTGAISEDKNRLQDLKKDLACFRLVLKHRSYMSLFRLRTEIDDRRSRERFSIEYLDPQKHNEDTIFVMLQSALEITLRNNALATRLRQNLDFAQVVYDVLFYPTLRWREEREEDLDCTFAVLTDTTEYGLGELSQDDQEFVHLHLLDYLNLVANKDSLAAKVAPELHDVIAESPDLLIRVEEGKYRWLRKPDGTSFRVASLDQMCEAANNAWDIIKSVAESLDNMAYRPALPEVLDGLDARQTVLEHMQTAVQELAPVMFS